MRNYGQRLSPRFSGKVPLVSNERFSEAFEFFIVHLSDMSFSPAHNM